MSPLNTQGTSCLTMTFAMAVGLPLTLPRFSEVIYLKLLLKLFIYLYFMSSIF